MGVYQNQILISKRANIYFLEKCKICVDGEKVVILSKDYDRNLETYINLPDKNTSFLLLGKGTSITNEAVRLLTSSCVLIGFCGSGGTPVYNMVDWVFLPYFDEYRPTLYMRKWVDIVNDENNRLSLAKLLLKERNVLTKTTWDSKGYKFITDDMCLSFNKDVDVASSLNELLLIEARRTKLLYSLFAREYNIKFKRLHEFDNDIHPRLKKVNVILNQGNYLAYGCAAVVLQTLGISFSYPILHGKTRRGALVFDIADLMKDSYIIPNAFELAFSNINKSSVIKSAFINDIMDNNILDLLFEKIKYFIDEMT